MLARVRERSSVCGTAFVDIGKHQMPIASAFLSNCSVMPQILFWFRIDASSTHLLKYAQPFLQTLLSSTITSCTAYHGALIMIHERAMKSLSEGVRMHFDRM